MTNSVKSLNFFISYSHLDMKYKEKLLTSLKPLEGSYNINVWHDGKILSGSDINKSIITALNNSNIILLLITPNYLASYYCMKVELSKSIKKMKKGECIVIPVIFQECTLTEAMPFFNLTRVPKDGKPICNFKPQMKGCVESTDLIKALIDETFPSSKKILRKSQKNNSHPNESPYIELYKEGQLTRIVVNQKFINIIPQCTNNIKDFTIMMEQALKNATKHFRIELRHLPPDHVIENFEINELRLFLMDICGYIKKYITDSVGIRVHFRGTATKVKQYIGLIASTDNDDSDDLATDWTTDLTPIPVLTGLIHYSAELKAPLLKTLNTHLNYKATNDKIWKEYITYTFVRLNSGRTPVLSMGISVHKDYYPLKKELFLYLAYIRFGELIENYIIEYCKQCKRADKNFDLYNIINSII